MKLKSLFISSLLVSTCICFTACSDNDDNNSNGDFADNIAEVFPNGMISSIINVTSNYESPLISEITRDKSGRVTSMKYRNRLYQISYPKSGMVVVTQDEYDYETDTDFAMDRVFTVDKNGFVTGYKISSSIYDYENYELNITYDATGHMVGRIDKYSDEGRSGIRTTELIYDENGDIIKVVEESDFINNGIKTSSTITKIIEYTSSTITKPIENVGGIMLYDEFFGIDFDDDICLFYAGLLGKATTHLPLSIKSTYDDGTSDSDNTFLDTWDWTINSDGYASSVNWTDKWGTETFKFKW